MVNTIFSTWGIWYKAERNNMQIKVDGKIIKESEYWWVKFDFGNGYNDISIVKIINMDNKLYYESIGYDGFINIDNDIKFIEKIKQIY